MSIEAVRTVASYLGAIGVGSLLTIFINHYFLSKENKKKLLFEARVKAYSGLASRFFNLFNETDINRLGEALRYVKINEILSEAYLLGSSKFVEKLEIFKPNLLAFHKELDEVVVNKKKNESDAIKLHGELVLNIGALYNQMRADLFLEEAEIKDEENPDSNRILKLRGLSEKEIANRTRQSLKEIIDIEKASIIHAEEESAVPELSQHGEEVSLDESQYQTLLPKIEENAIKKLSSAFGKVIDRQVSFIDLPLQLDGAIVDNDAKLLRFVEVKVFPNLPKNRQGRVMTYLIVASLRRTLSPLISRLADYLRERSAIAGWRHIITIAVVLNTKAEFVRVRRQIEALKDEFTELGVTGNLEVNFVFYQIKNMELDLTE